MKTYNTLSGKLEEFRTIKSNKLKIYVCGITPYDTTHLGHAFTYITFDALIRYLKYKGYEIDYTQNVTDINDRDNDILKKAKEENTSWQKLGAYWTKKFLNDMSFLNWTMPNNFLYASKQIDNMIILIQKLLKNKNAYIVRGSVYLDISTVKDYGKLSKLSKNEMLKIAKEFEEDTDNPDKKNPLDITLWRKTPQNNPLHIPSFSSSFGKGRPGWHIECSAMAIETLGQQIDIHGGGKDLIFPHHEAEIAQSENATKKKPFSNFWMHTGQVGYNGQKMSKSLGNLVMVSSLSKKYSSNAIRFLLLSNHYRGDWEFKDDDMDKAAQKMTEIEKALGSNSTNLDIDPTNSLEELIENDLNIPAALELIYQKISEINPSKAKYFLTVLGFKI